MNTIKEKWREITVVAVIVFICILLFLLINSLIEKREDAIFTENIAERRYNNILSGETSVAVLEKELEAVIKEMEILKEKLPQNYRIQDANLDLTDIIKNTKILNRDNCEVTEIELHEDEKYKKFEVKVKSFYGTYNQIKEFISFIDNYKGKIVIEKMDFERESLTGNMQGRSMILTFYGVV